MPDGFGLKGGNVELSQEPPLQPRLPTVGLLISVSGIGISVALAAFMLVGIIRITWNDSNALLAGTLIVLVPYCIAGLVVSIVSAIIHRDKRSVEGCVLGLVATFASLVAWLFFLFLGAASHPV
jgi:hypothetical protein